MRLTHQYIAVNETCAPIVSQAVLIKSIKVNKQVDLYSGAGCVMLPIQELSQVKTGRVLNSR